MLDTSAFLPALVSSHELHQVAREHVPEPAQLRLPGIVLSETYARVRGEPFRAGAAEAGEVLRPWWRQGEVLETPALLYARVMDDAPGLNLGAQIFDYLIVLTCAHHGVDLVTADRRQGDLGRAVMESRGLTLTVLAGA